MASLTDRERAVWSELVSAGNAGQRAQRQFASVNTVKGRLRSLYRKLGCLREGGCAARGAAQRPDLIPAGPGTGPLRAVASSKNRNHATINSSIAEGRFTMFRNTRSHPRVHPPVGRNEPHEATLDRERADASITHAVFDVPGVLQGPGLNHGTVAVLRSVGSGPGRPLDAPSGGSSGRPHRGDS
ncbi:hypothetical protein GCM10023166_24360 [Paeniglutamicibacter cryotolerans]|uniref:DNA-binding CsgD family transcriptional regulator n=1 Tax=Paeniglutamicibacter cryotolerans TaxID=670079 RepID=A0A839QMN5_9MICC|nr:DNA-binding CsgD family transcriptional regulator [Paeniglutamicibacter cryotolerans]